MATILYHGSQETTKPTIKIGRNALGALDNVFDGIFASSSADVAESHGNHIYEYEVSSIATSNDLDCAEAIAIVAKELSVNAEVAQEIVNAVTYEQSLADFAEHLNPRSDYDTDDLGWEMQRLRGVIARKLGFDAVECTDEHGTSYLIVK